MIAPRLVILGLLVAAGVQLSFAQPMVGTDVGPHGDTVARVVSALPIDRTRYEDSMRSVTDQTS